MHIIGQILYSVERARKCAARVPCRLEDQRAHHLRMCGVPHADSSLGVVQWKYELFAVGLGVRLCVLTCIKTANPLARWGKWRRHSQYMYICSAERLRYNMRFMDIRIEVMMLIINIKKKGETYFTCRLNAICYWRWFIYRVDIKRAKSKSQWWTNRVILYDLRLTGSNEAIYI